MRRMFCVSVGLLLAAPALAESRTAWPEGHQAAVLLTYDDAIAVSDLDVAVPQLNRVNLKGTFFLMGKAMSAADVPRWRAVASGGECRSRARQSHGQSSLSAGNLPHARSIHFRELHSRGIAN